MRADVFISLLNDLFHSLISKVTCFSNSNSLHIRNHYQLLERRSHSTVLVIMKNPLANCRIAVSGNLPSSWTSAKLLGWIENNGGELEKGIKKSTTHLVCSEEAWLTPCDMGTSRGGSTLANPQVMLCLATTSTMPRSALSLVLTQLY